MRTMGKFTSSSCPSPSFTNLRLSQELAQERPCTYRELRTVQGMGEQKQRNYGQQIMDVSEDLTEAATRMAGWQWKAFAGHNSRVCRLEGCITCNIHGMLAF